VTSHVGFTRVGLQMNSPKDLLNLVIQTMQSKAERAKELVQVIYSLNHEVEGKIVVRN
jgi:hypothetical protein